MVVAGFLELAAAGFFAAGCFGLAAAGFFAAGCCGWAATGFCAAGLSSGRGHCRLALSLDCRLSLSLGTPLRRRDGLLGCRGDRLLGGRRRRCGRGPRLRARRPGEVQLHLRQRRAQAGGLGVAFALDDLDQAPQRLDGDAGVAQVAQLPGLLGEPELLVADGDQGHHHVAHQVDHVQLLELLAVQLGALLVAQRALARGAACSSSVI